jgi:hypothetical protein
MATELVYHDLIEVVPGRWRSGLYWLRLFRSGSEYVAVITEVPGNPSCSVTNRIEYIARHIIERFGVDQNELTLYEVHPRTYKGDRTEFVRVTVNCSVHWQMPEWRSVTREDIESHVSSALPELPAHEELYRRVLERGGGTYQNIYRDVFEAVNVRDLPPFHNPSRCAHFNRFRCMEDRAKGPLWSHDDELRIGQQFIATLTSEDVTACPFHEANWRGIADESVKIINGLGPQDARTYQQAAERSDLWGADLRGLVSLFKDPIRVDGGSYVDGQHRGCALRFSGAARAAVIVRTELVDRRCADWRYQGDG